jgi:exopolysaccharide biosynthesis polyprenyl glycosylphosphotransferase
MLKRNVNFVIVSVAVDLAATLLSVALAFWLRATVPFGRELLSAWDWNALYWETGLIYPLVFFSFYLYDPDRAFRGADEYQALLLACLVGDLALAGLVYFTEREISRLALVYFYVLQLIMLVGWRAVVRGMARINGPRRSSRRLLLVGGGEPARRALEQLGAQSWPNVQLLGYLTDGPPITTTNGALPRLGTLSQARQVVDAWGVDDVLLCMPAESYAELERLVGTLIDSACSIWVVPDFFSLLLYGSRVAELAGLPMISVKAPTLTGYQRMIKRVFDVTLGSAFLLASLPVMAAVALAVRLDSPGPVIFRQQRVGENGRLFWTYKFRSMVADAEQRLDEVLQRDRQGNLIHKRPDDRRTTRVGRFIRHTSLDELPQLLNVLRGEMSLVGPRPELPIMVDGYQPWQRQRFAVPPGITGWWQVSGRSDKPMHLNTEYDLYYVQNYSLLLDIKILLKTVGVVLSGKGAY